MATATSTAWLSPRSALGSALSSVVVHLLLYGGVILILGAGILTQRLPPAATVELGYQVFDEPPPPAKVVQRVVRVREPVAPSQPKVVHEAAPRELHDEAGPVAGTQQAVKPQAATGADTQGVADATPFYKIKPKYPRAALVSGTEGWILLRIDINEKGEVENVRVVDGAQRNMFQDEARRAVEKWKYKPFLDSKGIALKKTDHQVRVDFKLADAG